jgi:hypothetical protein
MKLEHSQKGFVQSQLVWEHPYNYHVPSQAVDWSTIKFWNFLAKGQTT